MRESDLTSRQMIQRIAFVADEFSRQAGVGAMETAGSLVSYLAKHPEDLEPFLNGGIIELPMDWHEKGDLSWHSKDGRVVSPEYVRNDRTVKRLGHLGEQLS